MHYNTGSELNKGLPIPLYYQLKESLKKRIVSKEWKPGTKIPTESEICEMYDVSRVTVRKALEELQLDGYLDKKQGKGTFVRDTAIEQKLSKFYSFSEELNKRGLKEQTRIIKFEPVHPADFIAEALQIHTSLTTYCISRVRLVGEEPYAFEKSYIPTHLAKGLTEQMIAEKGLYNSLAFLGVQVDSATEKFRAINLDTDTAQLLGVQPHEAAISMIRVAYSGTKRVEYCDSAIVGDFFSYTVELK